MGAVAVTLLPLALAELVAGAAVPSVVILAPLAHPIREGAVVPAADFLEARKSTPAAMEALAWSSFPSPTPTPRYRPRAPTPKPRWAPTTSSRSRGLEASRSKGPPDSCPSCLRMGIRLPTASTRPEMLPGFRYTKNHFPALPGSSSETPTLFSCRSFGIDAAWRVFSAQPGCSGRRNRLLYLPNSRAGTFCPVNDFQHLYLVPCCRRRWRWRRCGRRRRGRRRCAIWHIDSA